MFDFLFSSVDGELRSSKYVEKQQNWRYVIND